MAATTKATQERVEEFQKLFKEDIIDLDYLRTLCFEGIPDASGIRPICWSVLLRYLPEVTAAWSDVTKKNRETYESFIREMIIIPGAEASGKTEDVVLQDHPLNPAPESQWRAYFQDNEMLLQIDKDCRRLCPDLAFFQSATAYPCKALVSPGNDGDMNTITLRKRVENTVLDSANVSKNRLGITNMKSTGRGRKGTPEYMPLPQGEEAHWEVVERMLFVYAKLNPGIKYVQGMNEILGPVYYTFASNPDTSQLEYAEPDAFFCFTNLMAEIRDNFMKSLDNSSCGIGSQMDQLMVTLSRVDRPVFTLLSEQNLKPEFFAFRWITLLLSQEFMLPDVVRLWDSLFSVKNRSNFLVYVCIGMMELVREDILTNDFASNMKLLQNYPPTDIEKIVAKAKEIERRS